MLYTAQRDGDWRDAATWGTQTPPGMADQVSIPAGISVTISGAGRDSGGIVQSTSTIDISGTLSLKLVSTYTDEMPPSGLTLYSGAALTIEKGGTLAISATGCPNLNAHAVLLSAPCTLTNNGAVSVECYATPGGGGYPAGLAYGFLVDDSNCQFINNGTISILNTDKALDGNGHCYGIWVRNGVFSNSTGATVTTTAMTHGSLRLEGGSGTFDNAGSFVNSAHVLNTSTITNSGTITHVFPTADYFGGGALTMTGGGQICLSGTVSQAQGLDGLPYGIKTYNVSPGDTLTVGASLSIPNNYTLQNAGTIGNSSTITILDGGKLKHILPTAAYSGAAVTIPPSGTGIVALSGYVQAAQRVDLDQYGASSYNVILHETLEVHATGTLGISQNVTLDINSWANLNVQGQGLILNKGTIANSGFITNVGTIKHHLPDAAFSGSATTGSGATCLEGSATKDTNLNSFGATSYQIATGDALSVECLLTIPNDYTLQNGGSLKYVLPNAKLSLSGTLTNSGQVLLKGSVKADVTLVDYGVSAYEIAASDGLDVHDSGTTLTVPEAYTLTIAGNLDVRSTVSNGGMISTTGSGSITGTTGTIVHVFPSANYSGNAVGTSITVALEGSVDADSSLGSGALSYGCTTYVVKQTDTLTLSTTLTIPKTYTLSNNGKIIGNGTIANSGIIKHEFPNAVFGPQTYTGTGRIDLGGTISDSAFSFATFSAAYGGATRFTIDQNDNLTLAVSVTLPAGFSISVQPTGVLTLNSGSTLSLNDPPSLGVLGSIDNNGSFENMGKITISSTAKGSAALGVIYNNPVGSISNLDTASISMSCTGTLPGIKNAGSCYNTGTICGPTYAGVAAAPNAAITVCPQL